MKKIDFGVPCHRELLEWGVGVLYFNKCQELINWSVNYLTSLQSALVKSAYRLSQTPPLPPPPPRLMFHMNGMPAHCRLPTVLCQISLLVCLPLTLDGEGCYEINLSCPRTHHLIWSWFHSRPFVSTFSILYNL